MKLARRHLTIPLTCKVSNHLLTPVYGTDDEPLMFCWYCGTKTTLGQDTWDKIIETVNKFAIH